MLCDQTIYKDGIRHSYVVSSYDSRSTLDPRTRCYRWHRVRSSA